MPKRIGELQSGLVVNNGNSIRVGTTGEWEQYSPSSGGGDMLKSENLFGLTNYEEARDNLQVYSTSEVNNLLKNVGLNLFTLTETVVINSVTYAQSCTSRDDSRYSLATTTELTTGAIATTLNGIGSVSDANIFTSLPETTATIHLYARKSNVAANVNVQFNYYKLTNAGISTLIGTSSIATIDSATVKEYDLTVVISPTTFASTDRLLRIPTYTKVGGGANPTVSVSVEGPSNYTFVTIPVSVSNIKIEHNSLEGIQGGITDEYFHLTNEELIRLNNVTPTNNNDIATKKYVDDGLNTKQATLISSVNIKQINGNSVLGSGNITIDTGLVGTKVVDQSAIGDDKILVYKAAGDKYVLEAKPSGGGGLNWGDNITGTSGTGILTTVGNNSVAGTIGQNIIIGNTNSNGVIGLNIDTGTAADTEKKGIFIKNLTGYGGQNSFKGGALVINSFNSTTQSLGNTTGITYGALFNTTSSYNTRFADIYLQNNGNGSNTGIYITNNNTTFTAGTVNPRTGLHILQSGINGTGLSVLGDNNVASIEGLINYTLTNTQNSGSIIQKINTGTSTQGHKANQILLYNASTSARGIEINTSSTGTGIPIELITTGAARTAFKLSTGFTATTATSGSITSPGNLDGFIIVDIGGTLKKIPYFAN